MFGINAEHQFDRPSELSGPETQRRSPALTDIPVRESIKPIETTKLSKISRDGEMIPCNNVRGSNTVSFGYDASPGFYRRRSKFLGLEMQLSLAYDASSCVLKECRFVKCFDFCFVCEEAISKRAGR
jgi:hypothetical protein